ncbi:MAG: DUF2975 domain-containing protein [Bacteroidota bacterium]
MEIKINTEQILKVLYVFSWIIFIGVCVEAGSFIVSTILTLVFNQMETQYFWHEVDLSNLYAHDSGYFFVVSLIMIVVAILRAYLFYLIVKILHGNKLNMAQPFNHEIRRFIFKLSYISLLIGMFSLWGVKNAEWLVKQGIQMPDIQYLRLGGADVWLFMSVTIFVIAQIYKRGIEIQEENELTV